MNEAFKPIAEQAPDNSRDELAEIPDFDPERAKENFECERTRLAQEEQNGRADKPRMMGFSGRILSEYDKRERERIDRLKTDMEDGKIDERTGIKSQGPVVRS